MIGAVLNPWRPAAIALAIVAALATAAAWFLGDAWLEARDARVAAEFERDQARGAALSCSAGVKRLQAAADKRAEEGAKAQAEARAKAETHEQRAHKILSSPPAVPGDACKSAERAIDDWLSERIGK